MSYLTSPAHQLRRQALFGIAGVLLLLLVAAVAWRMLYASDGSGERQTVVPTKLLDAGAPDKGPDLDAALVEPAEFELIDVQAQSLEEQRANLFENMRRALRPSDEQMVKIKAIFQRSDWMGQGNPKVSRHPMTRAECQRIHREKPVIPARPELCGAPYMVPLYDPSKAEKPEQARVCIDQFEFPNIPCEYPVVWVQANQAIELCEALGKRICDTHEWEGACAGALREPAVEYAWGERRLQMEYLHNKDRPLLWAYGEQKNHELCAMGSRKSDGCNTPTWQKCGTNTYPAGAFPRCSNHFGVYDLHGNAAEHMNLPMRREELASAGGYGQTEMKGSWFIFAKYEAHPDDCRWRARNWHGSAVTARGSHRNYHLGFRCCKNAHSAGP